MWRSFLSLCLAAFLGLTMILAPSASAQEKLQKLGGVAQKLALPHEKGAQAKE